ncbi:DUF2254 domain-containing protein [Subtercola sp. Z020]|uniref:DUF2254 domain-containing protein n=1 Tax=Subtercola sp. Z020 TaxID=2080582 RepID=UPI00130E8232|nr:DUF2254 domain-containing protein [Subtercola sp. Z020]
MNVRRAVTSARESFWFLPAVGGLVALALAEGLVTVDRQVIGGHAGTLFFLNALSASGGRSILSIIGTSMLTVAGTTFSITISVLATTSSTYGPRLVRNFMADRANQFVLAVFTSTFLYALVVLRSVHTEVDDNDSFVPLLAIHVAVLLAVLDVAVLVFFIHHIADSVQITTLQRRVQRELTTTVDLLYPDRDTATGRTPPAPAEPDGSVAIMSETGGYVQRVDFDALCAVAENSGAMIEVEAMPGSHLIRGDALAQIFIRAGSPSLAAKARIQIADCFLLGSARTPTQDVRFALQQLVEIAVRGLASGSNDPYTAVSALDLSAESLVPLYARPAPRDEIVGDDGRVLVVRRLPAASDLIGDVFGSVRTYGVDHPAVVEAALRLAVRLHAATPENHRRQRVAAEARALIDGYEATGLNPGALPELRRLASSAGAGAGAGPNP